jgi:hypothetical protein
MEYQEDVDNARKANSAKTMPEKRTQQGQTLASNVLMMRPKPLIELGGDWNGVYPGISQPNMLLVGP